MSIYYLTVFHDTVWAFQQWLPHIEEVKNPETAQSLRLSVHLVLKAWKIPGEIPKGLGSGISEEKQKQRC